MSITYRIFLHKCDLPGSAVLESAVQSMAPEFAFAGPYDFASDDGACPCRLGDIDCGFEWDLAVVEDVSAELAGQGFDYVGQMSFRSEDADAICVVLVAAHLAVQAGGVVVTPEGERIGPQASLRWASGLISRIHEDGYRARQSRKAACAPDLVQAWLAGLPGARVERLTLSPGDPRIGIRFSTGLVLMTRRWSVAADGWGAHTTAALPRDLNTAQFAQLEEAGRALTILLDSGSVSEAVMGAESLKLRFAFPRGVLVAQPEASASNLQGALFDADDRWELAQQGLRVRPRPGTKLLELV